RRPTERCRSPKKPGASSAFAARRDGDGADLMRLCRFDDNRLGLVTGEELRDITPVIERLPARRWPLPAGDPLIAALDELKPVISAEAERAPARPLAQV